MEEAYFGKEGIAAGARPGTIVIEASTMTLELKERLRRGLARRRVAHARLPDQRHRRAGGRGRHRDLRERRPPRLQPLQRVFDGFARSTYYCGEFGVGSKLKFVANLLVTIHNLSTAEAMVVGEKAGLDLDLLYRVIGDGAGRLAHVPGARPAHGGRATTCRRT